MTYLVIVEYECKVWGMSEWPEGQVSLFAQAKIAVKSGMKAGCCGLQKKTTSTHI